MIVTKYFIFLFFTVDKQISQFSSLLSTYSVPVNMDTHALHSCFEATLKADANIRKDAELQLKAAESTPGFISSCLDIVVEPQVSDNVKTASAIYLKNKIHRNWDPLSPVGTPILENEKPAFRERLIPAITKVSPHCRPLLVKTLNIIVIHDFPKNWPELFNNTLILFQASDLDSIRTAITCLLEISKHYRWTTGQNRAPFDDIITSSFPGILNIANSLLNETSITAAEMLKEILKTYKCSIYQELPAHFQDFKNLTGWATLMLNVIKKDLPEETLKLTPPEREANLWVKCKKWSFANLYRLLYRYAAPRLLHNKQHSEFSSNFIVNYVPEIIQTYFQQIDLWVQQKVWLSKVSLYYILTFLEECIYNKSSWLLIKPHTEIMISHVVFPLLCTTDDDVETFETDPEEYIHKHIDLFEENSTPETAAINFLVTLIRKKSKSCLSLLLQNIQKVVQNHIQNSQDLSSACQHEAALKIMGALAPLFMAKSEISINMEQFLVEYVLPDFSSSYGFLRAQACHFLNIYADLHFSELDSSKCSYILKCLEDTNLPVQIEAALALQPLIRHDDIHEALSNRVPEIMTRLLDLANRVDIDSIAGVIEEFFDVYSVQLAPFAVDLGKKLNDQLMRLLLEIVDIQNSDYQSFKHDGNTLQEKTMTALGILNAMSTLLLALDNARVVILELEIIIAPSLRIIFCENLSEFYSDVFGLIENFTFCLKTISPTIWSLLPDIHAVNDLAVDFLDELAPCLNNYIHYGAREISQSPALANIFFNFFQTILHGDARFSEQDSIIGCSIGQRFLITIRGRVDQFLPVMLRTVIGILRKNPSAQYSVKLIEVVLASTCNNPSLALSVLEAENFTEEFFNFWFDNMDKLQSVYDLKLVILALLSVFILPDQNIPISIQSTFGQLSKGLVGAIGALPAAINRQKEAENTFDNPVTNSPTINTWNVADEEDEEGQEDVIDSADEEQRINNIIEAANNINESYLSDDDYAETVLDAVNPFSVVKHTFMELEKNNPERYKKLIENYSSDDIKTIDELVI